MALKEKALNDKFSAQVSEMVLFIDTNVDAAFDSLNSLSVLTTSLVKQNAEETDYPPGFITIPDVSQALGEAKNASNALVIAYMPKVLSEHSELWGKYSSIHSSWIAEEQVGGPMNVTPEIMDYVWEFTDYDWEYSGREYDDIFDDDNLEYDDDGNSLHGLSAQVPAPRSDEFYTPVWQLYPVPVLDEKDPFAPVINYNLRDRIVPLNAVGYIELSKQPVLLDVCDQADWFLVKEHPDILQTAIIFPVFGEFSEIVGYYTAVIPWEEFFKNSRGPDSMDMIIVMRNNCGEVFSMELKGDTVTILGEYDAHDRKFDKYERVSSFAHQYNDALVSKLPHEGEICLYNLHFYPSEK